jgi:hypothetical protein
VRLGVGHHGSVLRERALEPPVSERKLQNIVF